MSMKTTTAHEKYAFHSIAIFYTIDKVPRSLFTVVRLLLRPSREAA